VQIIEQMFLSLWT